MAITLSAGLALQAAPPSTAEVTQARELYVSRGCIACHQNPELTKAPALTDVSKKYASVPSALEQIKTSLAKGSIGKWGTLEMPPQAHVSEEERDLLARWVLNLHPAKELPPHSQPSISWEPRGYHGKPALATDWNPAAQELKLESKAGAVTALLRKPQRKVPIPGIIAYARTSAPATTSCIPVVPLIRPSP
jgi:cytochrome c